ncbi:MAG TPA: ATP-dependent Clp protease ATP-binding subunit ClpA, partial [Vicinamibacterales bacterium]|nr:ATP-dependent Clp protease ATP-binding subunit ClpA [Vicinamibacterales bacterium]
MSKPPVPFAPETLETIQRAFRLATDRRHDTVGLEHLLRAITEEPQARALLATCGVNLDALRTQVDEVLVKAFTPVPAASAVEPEPSVAFDRVVQQAVVHAAVSSAKQVDTGSLLVFMLQEEESHAAFFLQSQGLDRLTLLRVISHGGRGQPVPQEGESGPAGPPSTDPLEAYATDLVARAAAGQIDPLIGRALELERMIQVLCRRRKNNPLLVGEPGVGKTALAEGLALRIHEGQVPEPLRASKVYALDLGALLAGTRYRGDFEERVKQVLERLAKEPNAILFIDEIHSLVGAGAASGGAMDAGNLLKPALANGSLRCIGSTTFNDVKQSFDRDRALSRRFQKIDVLEPSEDETIDILKGLRPHYEAHHGVRYTDEAIAAAVALSAKHLKDLHLPDKAIDVLDEVGAAQKLLPADRRVAAIGPAQIEQIVARMARVPVQAVSSDDRAALATLDTQLKLVIFGQAGAIDEVASAIKLSRSGLRSPDKPIGNFLFAGPTGVGKTELARQLARILGIDFIRYDMSEYMEKHAVSRLIGAPPGYIGYEEGGLLIDAIRKSPHAVLLLDEVEKAHPDMVSILLQVMDHATLTDSHGRKADFRHVILIMTTNAGARDLSDRRLGFADAGAGVSSRGALEKMFTPEFRNRLDAIVHFNALGPAEIERVVDKQIDELRAMVSGKGVTIELDLLARAWLAAAGFDRAFGARPMARLIERKVKKPLSEAMLFGSLADGGTARIVVEGDEVRVVAT